MENIAGYIRVLASARVKQLQQKPFFGKPHLKFGQCLALWSYFFQVGGVMGAKHSAELDAFGHAFLGMCGEVGAVEHFFGKVARDLMSEIADDATIHDYVNSEAMKRLGFSGDASDFYRKFGAEKIKPETAAVVAWQYAQKGAALGAIYPQRLRRMFEHMNASVTDEAWKQARDAGIDLPPEPERVSYEDLEATESDVFMAYCQECCPEYYDTLLS